MEYNLYLIKKHNKIMMCKILKPQKLTWHNIMRLA